MEPSPLHTGGLTVHEDGSLEQRVHRLEEAVAGLQDTQVLEDRIVARLEVRLGKGDAEHIRAHEPPPSPPPRDVDGDSRPLALKPGWLLFDIIAEVGAIFRMFFDIRFHMAWSTRLVAFLLVPAILTSQLWDPLYYLPVVGGFLDKAFDLVLAFVLYKALSRDVRRYRQTKGR